MSALATILPLLAVLVPAPRMSPDEQFFTEQTSEAYQKTFNELAAKGWRLNRIKGYEKNGASRFDSDWYKPDMPKEFRSYHDIDREAYEAWIEPLKNNGYVEVLKSTWKANGKECFWTSWEKK